MPQRKNKIIEIRYLRAFRHYCNDFPAGKIRFGEPPDFIIETVGKRVGIELTQMFIDDGKSQISRQSIEAARDRITNRAKELAESWNVPPADVTLFFNGTRQLRRQKEPEIAHAVATVIAEGMPPVGENADLECHYGSIQPSEVDQILISRTYPTNKHDWKWLEMASIVTDAISYLQTVIQKKAGRLHICLGACDECWLLIVTDPLRASGKIRPNEASLCHVYQSPFSRTYLLDLGPGQLKRLSIAETIGNELSHA